MITYICHKNTFFIVIIYIYFYTERRDEYKIMTTEEYEKTKDMLVAWANYNSYVRQQKYEIDETIKLSKALEKNKDDVDCYIDEEIRETTYNALEYSKIRIKKLDIMIRETALFKETMDSIIDGLNVLDKNLLVARYIKRQDWDTMATFWPCEISSRQIQRIHRSLLNDILQKYRELSSKKQK